MQDRRKETVKMALGADITSTKNDISHSDDKTMKEEYEYQSMWNVKLELYFVTITSCVHILRTTGHQPAFNLHGIPEICSFLHLTFYK